MLQVERVVFEKSRHNAYLENLEKFFKLFKRFLGIK